jgi:hypothetical protein
MLSQIFPRLVGAIEMRRVSKDGTHTTVTRDLLMLRREPLTGLEPETIEIQTGFEVSCEYALQMLGFACKCHGAVMFSDGPTHFGRRAWALVALRKQELFLRGILIVEGRVVDVIISLPSDPE